MTQLSVEGEPVIVVERASIASNATWLSAATVAARLCSFALAICLGRKLGVVGYGDYGYAAALGAIIVPVADAGITTYVYREIALHRATGESKVVHLAEVKWLLTLSALIITGVIAVASEASLRAAAVVVLVVASLLADGVSAFVYGYFQGLERMRFQAVVTALAGLARSVGGIVCVFATESLIPVVAWMVAVSTIQLLVSWRVFHRALGSPDRPEPVQAQRVEWRSVLIMGLLTLFALVSIRADSIMLGAIKNHHAVGIYTAVYTLLGAIEIIPWQIAQAVVPVFARTYASDAAGFRESWDAGVKIALLVCLPAAAVVSALAHGALELPYGARFDAGSTALAILVWFAPLSVFNALLAGVLYGARREGWPTIAAGIGVVVNILLNLWAIPAFGIAGAAAVTVATEIAVLAVQTWFSVRARIAPLPDIPWARMALATLALVGVALALHGLPVLISGPLALIAYAAVALGTRMVDRAELSALIPRLAARTTQ